MKKIIDKLNQTQKIIISILITIALFLVTYPIAVEASNGVVEYFGNGKATYTFNDAFAFKYTWYVWLIYITIISIILLFLFKKPSN